MTILFKDKDGKIIITETQLNDLLRQSYEEGFEAAEELCKKSDENAPTCDCASDCGKNDEEKAIEISRTDACDNVFAELRKLIKEFYE